MKAAHLNRRFPGDVPRLDVLWAPRIRKIAALSANGDATHSGRNRVGGDPLISAGDVDRIDDTKEQGGRRIDTDETGIPLPFKVTDPHDENIRSCYSRGPGVAKAPRCAGLP